MFDKRLKIGHSFLHLNIALFDIAELPFGFLQYIATLVVNYVWMFVFFQFLKKIDLFSKDELILAVRNNDFFYAVNMSLFWNGFIDKAVASTDNMSWLVVLIEVSISVQKFNFSLHNGDL